MAYIDYGAIAFKNGKLISTDIFTDMFDMVGWEDTDDDTFVDYNTGKQFPIGLKGNFMAYIGDSEWTIAFYKEQLMMVRRTNLHEFEVHRENFVLTNYTWSKWKGWCGFYREDADYAKVTKRNGYYVCRWKYKGDKYKVYFGYGVDLDYYKRWHIVNYYRSLEYFIRSIPIKIKDIIYNIKYFRE